MLMTMDGMDGMDGMDAELELELKELSQDEETTYVEPVIENEEYLSLFDEPVSKESNPILDEYLKTKGITDNKVTILNENNEEKQVDFYSLSKEEQLDFLNVDLNDSQEDDLEDSEVDFVNYLRENNMSVTEYLEGYKQSIIDELSQPVEQIYEIDNFDDQELYVLDLKDKYDLTDEELEKELTKELQDEVLFKKKVDKLRLEYQANEDNLKEQQEQEAIEQRDAQYSQFSDTMVNIAISTQSLYGIELEDDEKNEVLSHILDLDDRGTSDFYKSLNDPKKLYEAVWFSKYGAEAFDALKNHYEAEISKLKKDTKPNLVVKNNTRKIQSIHDLI